jgi:polysaccharide export outer membrane protein
MRETKKSVQTYRTTLCVHGSLAVVFWLSALGAYAQAPATDNGGTTPPTPATTNSGDSNPKKDEPLTPPADYLVSAGDTFEVAVLLHPELSKMVTVQPDGRISYPYIGYLSVVGINLSDFSQKIQKGLSKEITDPEVNVTLLRRAERTVSILGSGIRSPGKHVLNDDWYVLDLLAAAGDLSVPRPDLVTATLFRHNNKNVPIDLKALLDGDTTQNLKLEAGDTLVVEQRAVSRTSVQVQGEVAKPGWVPVPDDGSLKSVLDAVGGTVPQASLSHASIKRDGKISPLDLSQLDTNVEVATFVVQPGDQIFIPTNKQVYAVLGAVGAPKIYEYPDRGELTVMSAVTRAGGPAGGADLKHATVLRGGANSSRAKDEESRRQIADAFSLLSGKCVAGTLNAAGTLGFYPMKSTLPSSAQPIDGVSYRVTTTLQNGYTGYFIASKEPDVIPVNLEAMMAPKGDLNMDVTLKPGDIVFVPSKTPGRAGFSLRDALTYAPLLGWLRF